MSAIPDSRPERLDRLLATSGLKIEPCGPEDRCPTCREALGTAVIVRASPPPGVPARVVTECPTCWAAILERVREQQEAERDGLNLELALQASGIGDPGAWAQAVLDPSGGRGGHLARTVAAALGGDPYGVYLWGPTGVGKTHAAIGAVRAAIEGAPRHGRSGVARFVRCVWLEAQMHASRDRQKEAEALARVPLLVLDEFQPSSAWFMAIVAAILEERIGSRGRGTIVTSNLSLPEIAGAEGIDRVADRLKGLCVPVEIKGKSRRAGPIGGMRP